MTNAEVAELYRNQNREVPAEFRVDCRVEKSGTCAMVRKEKYGRIKKECQGIVFDSTLEADAWPILKLWESCGEITKLERQPEFILGPKIVIDGKTVRAIKYVADFIFQRAGRTVVVDCKGFPTAAFKIKAKLFTVRFPHVQFELWNRDKVRGLSRC